MDTFPSLRTYSNCTWEIIIQGKREKSSTLPTLAEVGYTDPVLGDLKGHSYVLSRTFFF
jgi:hypothetical protein